jgi:hypothetical protein
MTSRCWPRSVRLAVLVALLVFAPGGRAWAGDHDAYDPGLTRADPRLVAPAGSDSSASPLVARARAGKIVVRNRSGHTADVYLAPDDGVSDLTYVNTLPTGYKLAIRHVPRRTGYVLYAEDPVLGGGWGPRSFFLRRKFVWTLLP